MFSAVKAARDAIEHVADRLPEADHVHAADLAESLEHEIDGPTLHVHAYHELYEIRHHLDHPDDEVVAAMEALVAAHDAIMNLRLGTDPTRAAVKAIAAARLSGVSDQQLQDDARAARFH